MSVLATILCIVLSQELGFTKVLWIAAVIYAIGFLLMKPERADAAPEATAGN